jgi:hypothetical protein
MLKELRNLLQSKFHAHSANYCQTSPIQCSSADSSQLSSFSIVVCFTISVTLPRVVQADLNIQPRSRACWTAQLLRAFQRLRGCESHVRVVQTGHAIPLQEFAAGLKHRMRGVWRDAELVDPNAQQETGHFSFLVCHPIFWNERMPNTVPRVSIS